MDRSVILRNIFVQITFEMWKRNTGFYISRQEVQEGRFCNGHVQPWPWQVEVLSTGSVVALMTHKQLCQVVWGIVVKN